MEFSDMGLSEKTLLALAKINYVEPTEVQERVIPEIISGRNLVVRSHTGTGKTAAFGIGIVERITAGKSKKALILTPTRELAVQVCKEIRAIGQMHQLRVHVVYGGASINVQLDELHGGVDILVATPGRLIDLTQRGAVRIGEFDIAILDEADQMLDMGFIDDVTSILDQLPAQRLTLLLSATLQESIMSIAHKYVKAPLTIEIGEVEAAETIKQEHMETTDREKFPRLLEVLRSHADMKTLIFRETKMGASRLQERLWQRGVRAGVLQGDMTQAMRNRTIADFKEGRIKILVATNVAARGLHVDNLGLIVNYDKAQSEEIHLHRIGRTGRMGQEGKAINFIQRKETLDERMSADHPDFAWMKQGGTSAFSSERPHRRGPPRHGQHHGGRPSHGGQGARPHEGSARYGTGHSGRISHSGAQGGAPEGRSHESGAHNHGERGGEHRRRRPRY
ncbi:DEAD/DEAH box helicase [Candidatus Micrarchaeota archaeon]|nr:DEAD/DEAH box helicase [Candidatus Micrarchaeota archaeon]